MINCNKPYLINNYIAYYDTEKAKHLYEHNLMSEIHNEHVLTNTEVVHHLDLNRANNNPENLIYLENSQHSKLHQWITKGMPVNRISKKLTLKEALAQSRRCAKDGCNNIVKDPRNKHCSKLCAETDPKNTEYIQRTNKKWPDMDWLINSVNTVGYSATARSIGTSDNAIKKRITTRGRINEVTRTIKGNRVIKSKKK